MQLGSGNGVRSEINVTPLIDVVLVLLIIFMVVVPLVEARFVLAIPQTPERAEPQPDDTGQPLVVHLTADGRCELNGEPMELTALVGKLRPVLQTRFEKVVFFDADYGANYGQAVDVMDACRDAGAAHIGIIEEGPDLPLAPAVP